ncbi:MAG: DUF4112 domain-containing protein [Janthinobacterium lividum]
MSGYAGVAAGEMIDLQHRLGRLRRLAWLLDGAARIPGTRFRFGINSLIGLAPGVGDAVLAGISLWIVWEVRALGVPSHKLARMLGNVGIEAAMGAIPLLGDAMDVVFKANLRNLAIVEEHFSRH